MNTPIRLEFGQTFGRLVVLDDSESETHAKCACQCGVVRMFRRTSLRAGTSQSCGCIAKEKVARLMKSHGKSDWPEYKVWSSMKSRCLNPDHPSYARYGGRGITVCERWLKFENFIADMGRRQEGCELDRTDNNKGYGPENCAWVSKSRNCRNRSGSKRWVVYGVTYDSLDEAASEYGVSGTSILAWCDGYRVAGKEYPPRIGCWSYPAY